MVYLTISPVDSRSWAICGMRGMKEPDVNTARDSAQL